MDMSSCEDGQKGEQSLFGGLKWMSLDKADLPLVAEGL